MSMYMVHYRRKDGSEASGPIGRDGHGGLSWSAPEDCAAITGITELAGGGQAGGDVTAAGAGHLRAWAGAAAGGAARRPPQVGGVQRSEDGPVSRLTRLAEAAIEAIEASPEASGCERGLVLISEHGEGGSASFGFVDGDDAAHFLLAHAAALGKAAGWAVHIIDAGSN
jgi:hypothetical protein